MTLKELYPDQTDAFRLKLGKRVKACYYSIYKSNPPKRTEGEFTVCDYHESFLKERVPGLMRREVKKEKSRRPAIKTTERTGKRRRIQAVKVVPKGGK